MSLGPGRDNKRFFCISLRADQPHCLLGTGVVSRAFSDRVDVYHLPSSSAEVKNGWSCTSSSPVCLHGVKRDSVTFSVLCSAVSAVQRWVCLPNTVLVELPDVRQQFFKFI
jgi:hypothetical protein